MRDQPDVDPLANPDGTSPVRLLPGATPGTFRLRWRDRVVSVGRVVMPPDLALTVELVVGERVVAEQVVVPGVPFVLEADVPAGDGAVRSQVERAVRHAWQPAGSRAWSVSEVGELVWKGRLARERFVDGLAPAWQAVADSLRPTLQWNPVDGAASYRVAVAPNPWAEDADRAVVAELAWAPTADLLPGEKYGWTVQALDAEGELLAYSNAWFRAPASTAARQDWELWSDILNRAAAVGVGELRPHERVIARVNSLLGDAENGGVSGAVYNLSPSSNEGGWRDLRETASALAEIGDEASAALLARVADLMESAPGGSTTWAGQAAAAGPEFVELCSELADRVAPAWGLLSAYTHVQTLQ